MLLAGSMLVTGRDLLGLPVLCETIVVDAAVQFDCAVIAVFVVLYAAKKRRGPAVDRAEPRQARRQRRESTCVLSPRARAAPRRALVSTRAPTASVAQRMQASLSGGVQPLGAVLFSTPTASSPRRTTLCLSALIASPVGALPPPPGLAQVSTQAQLAGASYAALVHRPLEAGAGHSYTTDALGAKHASQEFPSIDLQTQLNTRLELSFLDGSRSAGPHILPAMRAFGWKRVCGWFQHEADPSFLAGPRAVHLGNTAWCLGHALGETSSVEAEKTLVASDICVELQLRTLAAAELLARGTVSLSGARHVAAPHRDGEVAPR